MVEPRTSLIDTPEDALLALSPLRRRLLELLREPGSAATLAKATGLPRQKLGYHLRALEAAGLVTLVEERRRRGFVERMLVASADRFVIDPSLLGTDPVTAQDSHASGHLLATAAGLVHDAGQMQASAAAEGKRLLTVTVEAELGFAAPGEFDAFAAALAAALADLARQYPPGPARRAYRVVGAALPTRPGATKSSN